MVLADLGRKINSALVDLAKAPVVDEKVDLRMGHDSAAKLLITN